MEKKIKCYAARNASGALRLFFIDAADKDMIKKKRRGHRWTAPGLCPSFWVEIHTDILPNITINDEEPTEVEITIKQK